MRHLEETLEEIKQLRCYGVQCFFGEDIGCDDLDVSLGDRSLQIRGVPVGYLGEVRCAWVGTMAEIAFMDLGATPARLPNPPGSIPREKGVYVWGVDSSVDEFLNKHEAEA